MPGISDELEEIRTEIQTVIDRLDDLAFRELRGAVSRRETKRPEIERRITRARNALVRALPLLHDDPERFADDVDY